MTVGTEKSKKPKILVISYLFPNSMYPEFGIFVLNRLKALSRYCRITVINPIPWFPFSDHLDRYKNFNKIPAFEKIAGLPVYHPRFFIIPRFFKFFDSVTYLISTFSIVKRNQFKFDLIDLHWTYPDILAGKMISKTYHKNWMVNIRGKAALNLVYNKKSGKYGEENSLRHKILKKLIVQPDRLITLSDELKQVCIGFGVNPQKTRTVHNGIDTERFCFIEKQIARKKLGLPQNLVILFSVGNLVYGKGFDRIIKGLERITGNHTNFRYYIAGSVGAAGDYKEQLHTMIRSRGLEGSVIFLGQVRHDILPLWYNAADIFCLSSRSEGCPNALMEALACGCPSVATKVGMVSDIFVEDFMGKLVNNDTKSVVEAIQATLSETYDRQAISVHMRQYTWDACARQILTDYYDLTIKE